MVDVDTRLLRAFVAVAEELNFTRAAQRLSLAQQALSAQVRQLEDRLGAKLFERTTRRVSLTEVGERLLPHARATLEALDSGVGAVVAARRAASSTLRVGLATTAVVSLTAEAMRRFADRHPDVALSVRNTGFFDLTGGLADGQTDVAFVRPPFRSEGLSMVTVYTEPRYAVLRRDHPLATREYVRPDDLVDDPWMWIEGADPESAAFWTLEEYRRGRPLRIGAHITSFDEYFQAAEAGLAIGTPPESAVRAVGPAFPQLAFVPLRDAPPATVAVAWRTAHETAAARAFVRTALEVGSSAVHDVGPAATD